MTPFYKFVCWEWNLPFWIGLLCNSIPNEQNLTHKETKPTFLLQIYSTLWYKRNMITNYEKVTFQYCYQLACKCQICRTDWRMFDGTTRKEFSITWNHPNCKIEDHSHAVCLFFNDLSLEEVPRPIQSFFDNTIKSESRFVTEREFPNWNNNFIIQTKEHKVRLWKKKKLLKFFKKFLNSLMRLLKQNPD